MLPWVHLYSNTQAKVSPCCISPWSNEKELGDLNRDQVMEVWNGTAMKKLRSKMLKDQKDSGCWQCYLNEENGLKSKRILSNMLYAHKFDWVQSTKNDGFSPDSKPIYWDIRISNFCNFKCRICGHHSSSKWYDDAKAMGTLSFPNRIHYSLKDLNKVLKQLEPIFPELEEIYFAGGEPLIMEEHFQMLNLLIEKGNTQVKLRYATNFSEFNFKGHDLFELWNKFEDVYIYASLDGSGKRGELQRSGQSWNRVLENRKRLLEECPKIKFLITPTISVFNLLHLPDFHREWVKLGLIEVDEMMPHVLKNPAIYDIRILPKRLKEKAKKKYSEHEEWLGSFEDQNLEKLEMVRNEFKSCITYLFSEDCSDQIPEFIATCQKLDELRNENTFEVFPELAELALIK